jgi:uncharacterized protein (TIGR02186 family)
MLVFSRSLFYSLLASFTILYVCGQDTRENQDEIRNLKVDPDHIEIGAFFKGKQIFVNAEIPECDGIVIEFEGKTKDLILNKKGKRKFLWLNVAQITAKNAPSVYFLASSDKLEKICSEEELEEESLGYISLKNKIIFGSDMPLTNMEFEEFIKLKERRGSYSINNKVIFNPYSNGRQKVSTTLNIPSFIPAGDYEVFLYCFRNRNLIKKASANFLIEEVGLTALIKNLAFGSPATYGIFAIVIALAAGIIIGILFSKRRSGGH